MANDLIPKFEVNGATIELKCTRALLVEYNHLVDNSPLSNEDDGEFKKLAVDVLKIEDSVNALADRLSEARDSFYDDPTDETKEAKFRKLEVLVDEQNSRLDGIMKDKDAIEKRSKIIIDIYEKAIIYALSEQGYAKSQHEAETLWANFVDEVGKKSAAEWTMAIGDTLFNKGDENSFLAQKRAKQMEMLEARKNIKRK